jgi:MFS family permease
MNAFLQLPRNVYLLALSQIIAGSSLALVVLTGGLIGVEIAPSPTLATLPVTLLSVGLALATFPAVMLMKKIGRKKGFIFSSLMASAASLLAAFAASQGNFYLLCFAILILGMNTAFVQQYRFAALESVSHHLASKAVSLILLTGVVSGFLGPQIVNWSKTIIPQEIYTGAFIILSGLFILAVMLLSLTKNVTPQIAETHHKERPLTEIIKQPTFRLAVLAGAVGFGVMLLIMTATPIHMHKMSGFDLDETVFVIQSHIVAMALPSLFTGIFITRFGIFKILIAGLIAFSITITLSITSNTLLSNWIALILLGVGWNFLFLSSTLLLSQSYHLSERFKVQGTSDFIIVVSQMIASFSAGSLLFTAGWTNINLLTIPLLIGTLLVFVFYRKYLIYANHTVKNN